MELTLQIRALRQERGFTLSELADKIGVSVPHLSEVERGLKNVNNHLLTRIASALNVEPADLIMSPDSSDDDARRLREILGRLAARDRQRVEAFAEALLQSSQGSERSE